MKEIEIDKKFILSVIRGVEVFQYFSDIQIDRLLLVCQLIELEKGDKIINKEEISSYLYIMLEGNIHIMLQKTDGSEVNIGTLSKGEIFGEAAIFINVKRTADAIADGKAKVLQIERNNFINFMKNNSEAGIKLLLIIVYNLLERLRDSHQDQAFEAKTNIQQKEIDTMMRLYLKKD